MLGARKMVNGYQVIRKSGCRLSGIRYQVKEQKAEGSISGLENWLISEIK